MSARADIEAGKAFVSLYVKQDELKRGLASARQNLNEFGSQLLGVGAKVAGVGTAMMSSLAIPLKLASDFEESFSKFGFMFGEATEATKQWGDEFANQVGRSKLQIVDFLGDSQALFVPIGFEPGAATDMSKEITKLSVDLASFYNKQDTDTFRDLHAALVGSSETMLKYGVIANEAAVKQELMNQAIDPKAATNQQKVMARYNIILRDTAAAQGDATRTADGAANSWKAFKAVLTDLAVEIGGAVLPIFAKVTQGVTEFIKPLSDLATQNKGLVVSFAAAAFAATSAGVAIMGVGIAAKATAIVATVLSTAYSVSARLVSASWYAVGLVITAFQLKSMLAAKILTTAWTVASTAISTGFKLAVATVTAGLTGATWIATAALIAAAWGAAAIAIAASYFGLGTVLATVAAAASTAWTIGAGLVGAAWAAVSGVLASLGISSSLSAAIASAAWSAYSVLMTAIAAKETVSAAILSLAWSGAATAASFAWTAFGAILTAVLTPANLLAAAGFAVSAAWAIAWASLTGPLMPFVVAAGLAATALTGIGIAATVAAIRSADLSSAIAGVRSRLQSVMESASAFGNVLMGALSSGDYAMAWQAAIEGGKLAVAEGVIAMQKSFMQFFAQVWGMAKTFMSEFVQLTAKTVSVVAKALSSPVGGAFALKGLVDELRGTDLNLGVSIDAEGMRKDALARLEELQTQLDRRAREREADAIRNEDPAKQAADREAKIDALVKEGVMTPEEAKAAKKQAKLEETEAGQVASAFDRETEALQEQIIKLREGEEAAERFRLAKQGLSAEQVDQVIKLRSEREKLEKEKDDEEQKAQAEKERIAKAMRWDPQYADPKDSKDDGLKSRQPLASTATTNVNSLIAQSRGGGASDAVSEIRKHRLANEKAEQKREIDAAMLIEKVSALGMWHA